MVTRAFAALASALLGLLLLLRLADGSSTALVQSWYNPVLLGSGLLLAGLAAVAAMQALRSSDRWDLRAHPRAVVLAAAVILPVALGLAITPRPLGSTSLKEDNAWSGSPRLGATASGAAPDERNLYEWAYELQSSAIADIIGDPVDVIGFVHHGKEPRPDRFFVARFVVACCVADAVGFTVPVTWAAAPSLERDTWVRVTGRIGVDADGAPVIVAAAVEEVSAPSNPYIYP